MCSELYFHSLLFPLHWGITVQFEWFICFGIVCSGLSGWSVEYAVCLVCSTCALWSSFGIQVDAWRLKFRTVTGTRGFFGKLVLSVCLSGYSQPHILYSSSSSSSSPSNSSIKLVLSVWIFLFSYSSSSSPSKFKEHCGRWTGKVLLFWGFSNSIFSSHGHHWETTSWHCFLAHRLETFSFGQSSKPNTFKFFFYYYAFLLRGGRFQEWAGISGK